MKDRIARFETLMKWHFRSDSGDCDLFLFLNLKDECFGFHQCLTASQTFSNLTVFLHARLSRKEDVGEDVYEDQKVTADFQVCGFDWACRG